MIADCDFRTSLSESSKPIKPGIFMRNSLPMMANTGVGSRRSGAWRGRRRKAHDVSLQDTVCSEAMFPGPRPGLV
jgi:hypothetical protein